MRHIPTLTALAALVVAATVTITVPATAAGPAADQKADGVIVVAGSTCTWTGASTSAAPPSALTVDRTTVNKPGGNLSCDGNITASLNNNPAFAFDDTAGVVTTDLIDITGKQSFISCRYKATSLVWDRDGTTRKYVNRPFTATKTSGSFLCPGSVTTAAGDASVLFR
ncbi:hypothetical protein ACFWUZ_08010 [Streptomyces sp. NPDC058646]|uniref:hypothetical protein n=1 Tax=Streptomyces sp. NPDC058646 TaxID=3346574 RepID=UPI00365090E5